MRGLTVTSWAVVFRTNTCGVNRVVLEKPASGLALPIGRLAPCNVVVFCPDASMNRIVVENPLCLFSITPTTATAPASFV